MKKIMMKVICLIVVGLAVLLMPRLSSAANGNRTDYIGKNFYLSSNIWNEKDKDILSINFHRGNIIPIGTEVTIDAVKKTKIIFTVNLTGIKYNFILSRKHSNLNIYELMDRYFLKTNPLKESSYKSLRSKEQECIKLGLICSDMTKKSVIMAYGYPPTHKTPSISLNEWNYWESRARRMIISFIDDKVIEVKGYSFPCNEVKK